MNLDPTLNGKKPNKAFPKITGLIRFWLFIECHTRQFVSVSTVDYRSAKGKITLKVKTISHLRHHVNVDFHLRLCPVNSLNLHVEKEYPARHELPACEGSRSVVVELDIEIATTVEEETKPVKNVNLLNNKMIGTDSYL